MTCVTTTEPHGVNESHARPFGDMVTTACNGSALDAPHAIRPPALPVMLDKGWPPRPISSGLACITNGLPITDAGPNSLV